MKVNMQYLTKGGPELNHFIDRQAHPARNEYLDICNLKRFVESGEYVISNKYVCISTTFETSDVKYKAFIGLDVEIGDEKVVFNVAKFLAHKLGKSIDVFKTTRGFHFFIPDLVFSSDFEYLTKIFEIANDASLRIGDKWVAGYFDCVKKAKTYKDLQQISREILNNFGHYQARGKYTFFDLRHIAHGMFEYERQRGISDQNNGVRTQLFFRITSKNHNDHPPVFIKQFIYSPS